MQRVDDGGLRRLVFGEQQHRFAVQPGGDEVDHPVDLGLASHRAGEAQELVDPLDLAAHQLEPRRAGDALLRFGDVVERSVLRQGDRVRL